MKDVLILGIDPGSLKTGFGLVRRSADGLNQHVAHGLIKLDGRKALPVRLAALAHDLSFLLDKYQPNCAVIEDIFMCKNVRSALILGQARGVAMGILGLKDITVHTLSPRAVKSRVAGRGGALKSQVSKMVALELSIAEPQSEDASDALALALAYRAND